MTYPAGDKKKGGLISPPFDFTTVCGSVPATTHECQDHQQQQAETDEEGHESETLDQEVIDNTTGPLAGKPLGDAFFLITLPLVTTLFQHLFLGDLTIEDNKVHGELLGTTMGIEEVDREDEAGSQQGFVRMYDGGHIERPAGQEQAEELREPEHQAGSADGEHTPEDGNKVEFLPVRPALEGRLRTLETEPSDHEVHILDVAQIETERIRTEQTLDRITFDIFPAI